MSVLVNLVGGYDSWQLAILIVCTLLIGSISTYYCIFGLLPWFFGCGLLYAYIKYELYSVEDKSLMGLAVTVYFVAVFITTMRMIMTSKSLTQKRQND